MRFYITKYRRWSLEEKLCPRDEILYLHKVFPENEISRAWDIIQGSLDGSKTIVQVISELQNFFKLNTVETFGLQEKFSGFKKNNLSFVKCFESLEMSSPQNH